MELGNIKSFLGEDYLKRFKVFHRETLFEPYWENLRKGRCPLCGNKLKMPQHGKMLFCNGKKHGKTFVISRERFDKLK